MKTTLDDNASTCHFIASRQTTKTVRVQQGGARLFLSISPTEAAKITNVNSRPLIRDPRKTNDFYSSCSLLSLCLISSVSWWKGPMFMKNG